MTSTPVPAQLTIKAILLGIALSMVLAAANAYLGLFVGLTVSASIPAAVISMAILRMFRNSNILENNIVQTAASAGESLAAGVIFTIPALILIGYWQSFDYLWVTSIALLGGVLGVLFTIPLRRSLIVEQKLTFPEGAATAEVLKVGDDPSAGIRFLALGALTGAVVKFCEAGLRIWSGSASTATYVGKSSIAYVGTNLSPALIGVGYIVGLNIATLVFIGGCISWYIAIPIYSTFMMDTDPALAAQFASGVDANSFAGAIWNTKVRYLGVGAMLIGGIWALISMRKSLVSGIRSGLDRYSHGTSNEDGVIEVDHREQDTPMKIVLIGVAVFIIPMFFLYQTIVANYGISLTMTLIMTIAGFLFSSVAGYMAGLVGSSNNPISGITIATILFASLILYALMGPEASNGPAAAIMIGAVVCCAAAIAGDNMQDLKAGYILGATPWKQQVMQGVGVASAAIVIAPVLALLLEAYGIGPASAARPDSLAAPQAALMASVSAGVFGGGLPWNWVWAGVLIGAAIIFLDTRLEKANATFRAPVLAVAVGIYLPLELSVPIFIGGIVAHFAGKIQKARGGDTERSMRGGMLFAAGLITGEALLGIFMAIPIATTGDAEVISTRTAELLGVDSMNVGAWLGLLAVGLVVIWLYNIAKRPASS